MKNIPRTRTSRSTLSAVALLGEVFFGCLSAPAQGQNTPTNATVTNASNAAVYANLTLGQPPTVPPANCTNLGQQIQSIADPRLVFTSTITRQNISFTPQTPGATELGYYRLAAGETITYQRQTFKCSSGTCSPAVTFNFCSPRTCTTAAQTMDAAVLLCFRIPAPSVRRPSTSASTALWGPVAPTRMPPISAPSMGSTRALGLW